MQNKYWKIWMVLVFLLVLMPPGSAQNPIIQSKYTADPAPMVYHDTVFLYTGHDEDDAFGFKMQDWLLYVSTDMVNWTDHGVVASLKDFKWVPYDNGAWAAQCVHRNGKFYLYCPMPSGVGIGVLVSDSPYGPFTDPIGKPLIKNGPQDIDPTVLIDDDGQAYLYWGNPELWYVKLNTDMISTSGDIMKMPDFVKSNGKTDTFHYQEGPWAWKRNGYYYMAYASTCCPEGIGYAMSNSPMGPWEFKGMIMDGDPRSNGNHPGIIAYKGNHYVFGNNYALLKQTMSKHYERRSVCLENMIYNSDGTIQKLPYWTDAGVKQLGHVNPYMRVEAECMAFSEGIKTEFVTEWERNIAWDKGKKIADRLFVTSIHNGDYLKVKGVDFASGATSIDVSVASMYGGKIEIHTGTLDGPTIGIIDVQTTAEGDIWRTITTPVKKPQVFMICSLYSGEKTIYLILTGGIFSEPFIIGIFIKKLKINPLNSKTMRKNSMHILIKTGKTFFIAVFLILNFSIHTMGKDKQAKAGNAPVFTQVVYQGADQVYKDFPLKPDEFYNPVLQGCYPDPSITRKGNDYYIVCSSFAMFPGVPIFHSNDLVNWKQIGHVLERTSQLKLENCGISAGVYAPQIIYNPYNDTFYMITTQFSGGFGNIVVKTKDPLQGWSDPFKLNFNGIDPSLFFDDNGKAYVVHNDAPDKGKELYNGHRVIKIWEYDLEKDQVIPGTDLIIVDGGVDLSKKPIWIEAPHIYKKNNMYYLMCAEGGTGDWHSEVVFISDQAKGPYKPAPGNPILTQRHFSKDRDNMVDWAGHADIVNIQDDQYFGVFLAIRPNVKDKVNIGRETFVLPVDWTGTFPVFENGLLPLSPKLKMPQGVTENKAGKDGFFPNGNFTFTENFTSEKLDYRWIGLRGPRESFIAITKKGLQINPFQTHIKEVKPTSTLFIRQQHNDFTFSTTMTYKPESEKDMAGIVCLQSEKFNYVFGITKKADTYYLVLQRTEKGQSKIIAQTPVDIKNPISLKVEAEGADYRFHFSTNGTDYVNLGGPVSGDILSTNVAGGFTGSLIGLYATSANDILPE